MWYGYPMFKLNLKNEKMIGVLEEVTENFEKTNSF